MKKLNFSLLVIALFIFTTANAQKVKVKKNTVFVDGKEYVTTSKRGMFAEGYSLYSLKENKEIIFVMDVPPQTEGEIRYPYYHYLIKFLGTGKEVLFGQNRLKPLIKALYGSNAISEDGLNLDGINSFIEKYQ